MKLVGVRFKRAGKIYTFSADEMECKPGDQVVVETERGMAMGRIATEVTKPPKKEQQIKKVIRVAEDRDIARLEKNKEQEEEARRECVALIAQKELPMKLLGIECLFDRSKVIFYFASEGRVDFRELVRDLARKFHTRIEMRQVGVRDEAKIVGGLGCCGRELCCATWLSEFAPIGVRMAKSQNISLNPAKISGICGRLMCCLAYEHSMYEELSRGMPKVGKKVDTQKGEGKVIRRNTLESTFSIYGQNGEVEVDLEDYKRFLRGEKPLKTDEEPVEEAEGAKAVAERGARPQRSQRPQRPQRSRKPAGEKPKRDGQQAGAGDGQQGGQQPTPQEGQQAGNQPGQQEGQQDGKQPTQQEGQQAGKQPNQQGNQQAGKQPNQQGNQQAGKQPNQQGNQQAAKQPEGDKPKRSSRRRRRRRKKQSPTRESGDNG